MLATVYAITAIMQRASHAEKWAAGAVRGAANDKMYKL
jgi:hypothetical protein